MILVASDHDYANLGHNVGKSLRSVGVDCVDAKLFTHAFKYTSESRVVTKNTMKALMIEASFVIIMHSSDAVFSLMQKNKSFAVYHTGTRFRKHPNHYLRKFARADFHLTDQTEFMRFPQMNYVVSSVDASICNPITPGKKLKIGHYPSNAEVKGTDQIVLFLEKHKKNYTISVDIKNLSYDKSLSRMNGCDVYFELFKPILWNNLYGCFGVTALEAAMMGKVVITQDLELKTYQSVYGEHPFFCVKDQKDVDDFLNKILSLDRNEFIELQRKTHRLAFRNHSHEATGHRLAKILGIRTMPKVSVIIYYNRDRGWLDKAIESVRNQNYDGEIELIKSHDINYNASQNLNAGIKVASGEFIKYLSEDDELTPNCISDSINSFGDDIDFIHGDAFNFRMNGEKKINEIQKPLKKIPTIADMLHNNIIHGGTVMYRKSFFEKYGLFDESLTSAEEYDLHLRAMKAGARLGYCNSFLYFYRRHDHQKSLGKGVNQTERKLKIEAIKDRYR